MIYEHKQKGVITEKSELLKLNYEKRKEWV